MNQELFSRAEAGDATLIDDKSISWSDRDKNGIPLIHTMAWRGIDDILRLPIQELTLQDNDGFTPLMILASFGHPTILSFPEDALMIQNDSGWSAYHFLAQEDLPELFQQSFEALSIADNFGETPVHVLAYKPDLSILDLDPNLLVIPNKQGNTSIHVLAEQGCEEIKNIDKSFMTRNNQGKTPIDLLNKPRIKESKMTLCDEILNLVEGKARNRLTSVHPDHIAADADAAAKKATADRIAYAKALSTSHRSVGPDDIGNDYKHWN